MILPDQFDFTQGNLQDYLDCPYRFYLRYILRTRWPALVVEDALDHERLAQSGARFHHLIQQYLLGIPEARLTDLAAADSNPDIVQWWDNFLTTVPAMLEGQRYVETSLSVHLAGRRLVAKYDLILIQNDGAFKIFDWKTSQKLVRKDWLLERVQTRVYRFLLASAGKAFTHEGPIPPEKIEMIYWFAPHPNSVVSLGYSQTEYGQDQDFFTRLLAEIQQRESDAFQRTPDTTQCRFCVYRAHCDRGTTAGNLDEFDAFNLDSKDSIPDLDFDQIEPIAF